MIIGKEVTPRRRVVIITLLSLLNLMRYQKIKELTGIPTSTLNNIWRHAVENARKVQHEGGLAMKEQIGLLELVEAKCLDPHPWPGRPEVLTEEDKDRLMETVKRNFPSRRMKLVDIRREAGLSHMENGTAFRALAS